MCAVRACVSECVNYVLPFSDAGDWSQLRSLSGPQLIPCKMHLLTAPTSWLVGRNYVSLRAWNST